MGNSARETIHKAEIGIRDLRCLYKQLFLDIQDLQNNTSITSINSISTDVNGKLIVSYTDSTGVHTIETESLQKFIIKFNVLNYTELLTKTPDIYDYAYVRESQGTQWLPGSLGGNYYSSGLYLYNGTQWVKDDTDIYNQLEQTVDNLSTKVDKITGKGLSTEDYTTTEKNKLASITEIFTTSLKTSYDNTVIWVTTNGINLLNHLTNTNNPHNVTASQIGALTTEIDPIFNVSEASNFVTGDKAVLDSLVIDKFDNPTGTSSEYLDGTGTPQTFPTIPSITGLATTTYVDNQDTLKVDKVAGKSLILDTEITRLASIPSTFAPLSAEENVQSDWAETNSSLDSFILNKPSSLPLQVLTSNPSTPSIGQQWILEVNTIGQLQYNSFMTPMVNNEKTYYLCLYNGTTIKKTILN